jgi:hypothetical protein
LGKINTSKKNNTFINISEGEMPKRNMTEEEKKAWGAKMKAAREKKEQLDRVEESVKVAPEAPANEDLSTLLKEIAEIKETNALLKAALLNNNTNPNTNNNSGGLQSTNKGIVGTFEKYIIDPNNYPDPRERLFTFFETEPKYRRLGFKDNYELRYEMAATMPYERKDGVLEVQPRFILGLDRIIYDEDTYEPTNGRYVVKEFIFFEDPQTAVTVARENGLDITDQNEKNFLNEMRYLRIRDWLIECFYPSKPDKTVKQRKDMVINGKQVQYYEVSSTEAQSIPFSELKTKI